MNRGLNIGIEIAASTAAREADWRFTRPGALVSPRKVGEDCLADQFRDLGDYGVSEGLEAKFVQPTPKPIIHSANVRKELWPRGFPDIMANLTGKPGVLWWRSEEHTYELQTQMRNSYAVFCLQTKNIH